MAVGAHPRRFSGPTPFGSWREHQGTDASLEPDRPDSLVVRDALVLFGTIAFWPKFDSSRTHFVTTSPLAPASRRQVISTATLRDKSPPRSGLVQLYLLRLGRRLALFERDVDFVRRRGIPAGDRHRSRVLA